MKLKYLLRGIGIGAILATAVMYFIYGKSVTALSDDEIMQKARELGMMTVSEFQDKELASLKDKLPEASEAKTDEKTDNIDGSKGAKEANPKSTPSEKGGEAGKPKDEADKTRNSTDTSKDNTKESANGNAETKSAEAGTAKGEIAKSDKTKTKDIGGGNTKDSNTKTEENKKKNVGLTTKPELKKQSKKPEVKFVGGKINFSITAGMSSEKVAASLKNLGLIDNSTEFNKYLVNNGYASKIKVGTFELQTGWSYSQIAAQLVK